MVLTAVHYCRKMDEKIMEGTTIVFIIVAAFVVWLLFIRQINTSNKTDDQLKALYDMAINNFMHREFKYSKELDLLHAEMEKRGLLKEMQDSDLCALTTADRQNVASAIKQMENNGSIEAMQEMFDAGIPERISMKIQEIARIKNVSEADPLNAFQEMFDSISMKYKNDGLSEMEADAKALRDVLITREQA